MGCQFSEAPLVLPGSLCVGVESGTFLPGWCLLSPLSCLPVPEKEVEVLVLGTLNQKTDLSSLKAEFWKREPCYLSQKWKQKDVMVILFLFLVLCHIENWFILPRMISS